MMVKSLYIFADVAKLADALDLGSSSREGVEVQVLSSAPIIWSVEIRGRCAVTVTNIVTIADAVTAQPSENHVATMNRSSARA
jgi:hypothetical protein